MQMAACMSLAAINRTGLHFLMCALALPDIFGCMKIISLLECRGSRGETHIEYHTHEGKKHEMAGP